SLLAAVTVFGVGGCAVAAGSDVFAASACAGKFYEHTFEYNRETEALSAPVAWGIDGDDTSTTRGLNKGHSSSNQDNPSLGPDLGFVSFGASGHHAAGDRDELIGLYDANGDGLADQIFRGENGIYVLYNKFKPGLDPKNGSLFVRSAPDLIGLDALGHEKMS